MESTIPENGKSHLFIGFPISKMGNPILKWGFPFSGIVDSIWNQFILRATPTAAGPPLKKWTSVQTTQQTTDLWEEIDPHVHACRHHNWRGAGGLRSRATCVIWQNSKPVLFTSMSRWLDQSSDLEVFGGLGGSWEGLGFNRFWAPFWRPLEHHF